MNHPIRINHNNYNAKKHGFFSACLIRLWLISARFHDQQVFSFPEIVDELDMFTNYKEDPKENIVPFFFKDYRNVNVNHLLPFTAKAYSHWMQHRSFKEHLPINFLSPFVKKYFEPSYIVKKIISDFETKHFIDYSNTAAIYYRGNDKHTESQVAPREVFIQKAEEILSKNPNVRFLVQTDETEFKDAFIRCFPDNSFFNEELPTVNHDPKMGMHLQYQAEANPQNENYIKPKDSSMYGARFFAMVLIMSKCKWLVIPTSNASLWAVLCRESLDNVFQMLNNEWITSQETNTSLLIN
jgi:hypothetical protein